MTLMDRAGGAPAARSINKTLRRGSSHTASRKSNHRNSYSTRYRRRASRLTSRKRQRLSVTANQSSRAPIVGRRLAITLRTIGAAKPARCSTQGTRRPGRSLRIELHAALGCVRRVDGVGERPRREPRQSTVSGSSSAICSRIAHTVVQNVLRTHAADPPLAGGGGGARRIPVGTAATYPPRRSAIGRLPETGQTLVPLATAELDLGRWCARPPGRNI
jgi:hypothetical protein